MSRRWHEDNSTWMRDYDSDGEEDEEIETDGDDGDTHSAGREDERTEKEGLA